MHQPEPRFPPLFSAYAIKAPATARDEACRRASVGELGAGDFIWSRNALRAECALVLEPEVALAQACQMGPLGLVALAETLGAIGPPQMPVEFLWPGTVMIDGASCGAVHLSAPACAPDAVPPWLVLSVSLTLSFGRDKLEPGQRLDQTALDLQGAGDVTRTMVIEALATRLLAWLHTWGEDGFRPIHEQWLFCAAGRDADHAFMVANEPIVGRVRGLDEDANLLLKPADGPVRALTYLPHVLMYP